MKILSRNIHEMIYEFSCSHFFSSSLLSLHCMYAHIFILSLSSHIISHWIMMQGISSNMLRDDFDNRKWWKISCYICGSLVLYWNVGNSHFSHWEGRERVMFHWAFLRWSFSSFLLFEKALWKLIVGIVSLITIFPNEKRPHSDLCFNKMHIFWC